jgi:hypothetical protein
VSRPHKVKPRKWGATLFIEHFILQRSSFPRVFFFSKQKRSVKTAAAMTLFSPLCSKVGYPLRICIRHKPELFSEIQTPWLISNVLSSNQRVPWWILCIYIKIAGCLCHFCGSDAFSSGIQDFYVSEMYRLWPMVLPDTVSCWLWTEFQLARVYSIQFWNSCKISFLLIIKSSKVKFVIRCEYIIYRQ